MMKINIVRADGWIAIYNENGNLEYQGDYIEEERLLSIVGVEYNSEYIEVDEAEDIYKEFRSRFPSSLKTLKDRINSLYTIGL